MDVIIILAVLLGIVWFGLKKTKSNKKSNSTGGGGSQTTDDVVGPKPVDNPTPSEGNPKPPVPKDFR